MKSLLWVVALLALSTVSLQAAPAWHEGELTLLDGRILTGTLNYNWKAEIVQIRQQDGTLKAFSASQIARFAYLDSQQNALRRFASVMCPAKNGLTRPAIMEEYVAGPYTVYRRLRHSRELLKLSRPTQFGNDEELVKNWDSFTYFVNDGGELVDLATFNDRLWPRMKAEFGPALEQYAHRRHLNRHDTLSQLLLINEYNVLKQQQEPMAAGSGM